MVSFWTCHSTVGGGLPSAEQMKDGVSSSPWENTSVCGGEVSRDEVI